MISLRYLLNNSSTTDLERIVRARRGYNGAIVKGNENNASVDMQSPQNRTGINKTLSGAFAIGGSIAAERIDVRMVYDKGCTWTFRDFMDILKHPHYQQTACRFATFIPFHDGTIEGRCIREAYGEAVLDARFRLAHYCGNAIRSRDDGGAFGMDDGIVNLRVRAVSASVQDPQNPVIEIDVTRVQQVTQSDALKHMLQVLKEVRVAYEHISTFSRICS